MRYASLFLEDSHYVLTLNALISPVYMVAVETYVKYISPDWQKITPLDFLDIFRLPFSKILKIRWNYGRYHKKLKVFKLIKIVLCTLCRHLLNETGCINYSLTRTDIRHSCDVQDIISLIRSKETIICR